MLQKWFAKKFQPVYIWNGERFPLLIDQEMFNVNYELLIKSFLRLLDLEYPIAIKDSRGVDNTIPVQLSNLPVVSLGRPIGLVKFFEWFRFKEDLFSVRLVNCIQRIHLDVDPLVLHSLKGRFFRCMEEDFVVESSEDTNWENTYETLPWVWLIPHYQTAFQLNTKWQTRPSVLPQPRPLPNM